MNLHKYLLLIFLNIHFISFSQDTVEHAKLKLGIGTSFFNLNESFDDLFFFNNSSPIYTNLTIKNKYRIETIFNLSIIDNKINRIFKSRGSISISGDFLKKIDEKLSMYYGPRVGLNTNETKLLNGHLGAEYFFHKKISIGVEIGVNYLINFDNYIQTNSNIIVRAYLL